MSFGSARGRLAFFLACASLALLGSACRSTDPALLDEDQVPLVEKQPADYRVAVAPFVFAWSEGESRRGGPREGDLEGGSARARSSLEGGLDEEALQALLVERLRSLSSASEVFAVATRDWQKVPRDRAELLLVPRITEAGYRQVGANGGAGLGTLLWYTTWIFGHGVEDYEYETDLRFDCEVLRVEDGTPLERIVYSTADEGAMALAYWDRNEVVDAELLATFVIPPFLTADDPEVLAQSLVERAATRMAARVKSALLEELPAAEFDDVARIEVSAPGNGSRVEGESVLLRFRVHSKRRIRAVLVFRDEELEPAFAVPEQDLASAYRGQRFDLSWALELPLAAEGQHPAIRIDVVDEGGRATRRTLVLTR